MSKPPHPFIDVVVSAYPAFFSVCLEEVIIEYSVGVLLQHDMRYIAWLLLVASIMTFKPAQ